MEKKYRRSGSLGATFFDDPAPFWANAFAPSQFSPILKLHLQDTHSHVKSVGNMNSLSKHLGLGSVSLDRFSLRRAHLAQGCAAHSWQSFPPSNRPSPSCWVSLMVYFRTSCSTNGWNPKQKKVVQIRSILQTDLLPRKQAVVHTALSSWKSLHSEKISTPSGTEGYLG